MKLYRTKAADDLLEKYVVNHPDCKHYYGDEWIDHTLVKTLSRYYQQPLFLLLVGTDIYHPPKINAPVKTKEYNILMNSLRQREKEEEYRRMTRMAEKDSGENISKITKEVNSQLTTIFNVLVSVVSVAWAFWYWGSNWPLGVRTLVSLFAGIGVAVAEVVVLNGYYRRLNEAKVKKNTTPPEPKDPIDLAREKFMAKTAASRDMAAREKALYERQKSRITAFNTPRKRFQ